MHYAPSRPAHRRGPSPIWLLSALALAVLVIASFPLKQIQMAGAKLQGLIGSYYQVAYSGGALVVDNNTIPYQLSGNGSYGFTSSGHTMQAIGSITTTFTWVPQFDGDVPPDEALICQNGSASAWASTQPGSASDGLGDPSVPYYNTSTSQSVHYWVKQNPGSSFSLPDVTPTASADGKRRRQPVGHGIRGRLVSGLRHPAQNRAFRYNRC